MRSTPSGSFSLKAEARSAILANGVSSAARAAIENSRTPKLSPVIRIDMDVILGEITSPEGRRPLPFTGDAEDDRDIRIVEPDLHIGFVERSGEAVAADLYILQRDVDLARVEIDAGITRRRENAAPVGIRTGDGRLDQRGVRDGSGDLPGRRIAQRA